MSKPNEAELKKLRAAKGDDEMYHGRFDDLLEGKLMILDPEWMIAMKEEYGRSGMARWCA